ncbi:MAG TPA: hypothetical protein VGQ27_11235 [Steroidobacteraceae bacterium]|jgi:hypothetical protein|nr:hypothetical protein [Steroidobacteraceae bacterium]
MKSAKWPVAGLLFASPLIGEYLLGSLPASMIALLPLMMAMYGAGAILIREVVRATGGGWASIVLLATAYGLLEEGFITQSLFNPDYLHLRLLDFGFLPALGTALPWALFVVSIHVVWSITIPIAMIESAFPAQRDRPWLGKWGRAGYALVFVAGATLIAVFSYRQVPFIASPAQWGVTGALIVALCVVAVKLPKPEAVPSTGAPRGLVLFLTSFLAGSAYLLAGRRAEKVWHLDWLQVVALSIGVEALFVALVFAWTRGGRWDERRRFALMAGGFLVYAWIGFETDISLHGRADLAGHALLATLLCAALGLIGLRTARSR